MTENSGSSVIPALLTATSSSYGASMSIVFLGETLHVYHAIGMAAIVVGLACSRSKDRPVPRSADENEGERYSKRRRVQTVG